MKEIEVLNINSILIQIDKRNEALNYILKAYPSSMTLKEVAEALSFQQKSVFDKLKRIINS